VGETRPPSDNWSVLKTAGWLTAAIRFAGNFPPDGLGHATGYGVGHLLGHHPADIDRPGVMHWTSHAIGHPADALFFGHGADLIAFFAGVLLADHLADLIAAGLHSPFGHHLADLVGSHPLLRYHLADLVAAGPHSLLRHHLANLIGPHPLLGHHLADLVAAGPHSLFGHHLADLVGSHPLLRHHLADLVAAGLYPLLANHFADLVALLIDNRFPLVADAGDLFFTDFGHPHFFANRPRWALNLDLFHWTRAVAPAARAVALPAAGFPYTFRDNRPGNLTAFGFPMPSANLNRFGEVDRLADGPADLPFAGLVDRLADRVRNLLRPRLVHRLAHRVALLAGLVDWLADRVRNLLRPRLIHRLADRVVHRSRASFPDRLADRVFDLTVALFFFVTNTVNFLLLDHLFADGLVAGVLLLLVDNVLHQPSSARGLRGTRWFCLLASGTVPSGT